MLSTNFGGYGFKVNATATVATLGLVISHGSVQAQIATDSTTNTQVNINGNISNITGGIQAGQNLFHSFQQFSLPTGEVVNFDNTADINNIFSRVTGGTFSTIDGLIQANGNANLFLLNPAGIIFGANAQLNIGGSFIATTGDRLIFEDGFEFSAVAPETEAILTISSPIGLQYGTNPGEITILPNANRAGSNSINGLSIQPNKTLALLGGNISITRNSLNGIASNIEISSIASGKIALENSDYSWQFNYANVSKFGEINLATGALVNNSGIVNFQGNTINLSTSGVSNFTDLKGEGGIINLEATESINLDRSFLFTQVGQLSSNIEQAILGAGGDILLKAPQIFFQNGSAVSAGTLSQGAGGDITIDAAEIMELSGNAGNNPSVVSTSTQRAGDGGQIDVNTNKLIIKDGSQIQALAGEGKGGTITVNAAESIEIYGTGILQTPDLDGNISETKLISGISASSGIENLPFEQQPQGDSGNLIINTPNLEIADEAQISVSNFGLSNAGDITISTNTLNLDTKGKIIANTASGTGGSINLTAQELVILNNNSEISTTAQQNGDGGNIALTTNNLVLLESDRISADAQQGSGGNITINTQGFFTAPESRITASSQVETKKGIVEIITLDNSSKIQTEYQEQSPLEAENYISTGCGVGEDFTKNQFRNIGRGGIPNNLMREITTEETLGDLGTSSTKIFSNRISKQTPKDHRRILQELDSDYQLITEANTWIINSQGKIELVAQDNHSAASNKLVCRLGH